MLVFSEIEDYRKILLYYLSCKWPFFVIFWFLCIVWYVVGTSSCIFTPNVEKCGFKYLFETPCGFKGFILLDVMQC